MTEFTVIIPARYGSTRLPGKPLIDLAGQSMIQRVYGQAVASNASKVIVATDDERVESEVLRFGGEVIMTSPDHPTGTDRIYEAAQHLNLSSTDIVVNVQGDEPLMPPSVIDQVAALISDQCQMATLMEPITDPADMQDPNIVKVVVNDKDMALYFSRSAIPYDRDGNQMSLGYRHLGIYAYTSRMLEQYVSWPEAQLEKTEKLEQLRVLANGESIAIQESKLPIPPGIDTQMDVERTLKVLVES